MSDTPNFHACDAFAIPKERAHAIQQIVIKAMRRQTSVRKTVIYIRNYHGLTDELEIQYLFLFLGMMVAENTLAMRSKQSQRPTAPAALTPIAPDADDEDAVEPEAEEEADEEEEST